MRLFVLFAAIIVVTLGQTEVELQPFLEAVANERIMASSYLDIVQKFQTSQHNIAAASYFLRESQGRADLLQGKFDENTDPNKMRLLAAFSLLNAVHIKAYQILNHVPAIQQQYYVDRAIQLHVSSLGEAATPQALQSLYIHAYSTQLNTLKLSFALQVVSHFRMWLEDEIDVYSQLVKRHGPADYILSQQEDSLVTDQQFAFNAYSTLTQLELQSFMINLYLGSMSGGQGGANGNNNNNNKADASASAASASASSSAAANSFLEEGAEFVGLGSFGGDASSTYQMFLTYYQWYYLTLQHSAAQSGALSANLQAQAKAFASDSDPSNDAQIPELNKNAAVAFTGYAYYLLNSSQIDYMLAIYAMYLMYSSMFAAAQPQGNAK